MGNKSTSKKFDYILIGVTIFLLLVFFYQPLFYLFSVKTEATIIDQSATTVIEVKQGQRNQSTWKAKKGVKIHYAASHKGNMLSGSIKRSKAYPPDKTLKLRYIQTLPLIRQVDRGFWQGFVFTTIITLPFLVIFFPLYAPAYKRLFAKPVVRENRKSRRSSKKKSKGRRKRK